jgi:hypothetical protein
MSIVSVYSKMSVVRSSMDWTLVGPVSSEEMRPIGKIDDHRLSCRRLNIDRTVPMLSRDLVAWGRGGVL